MILILCGSRRLRKSSRRTALRAPYVRSVDLGTHASPILIMVTNDCHIYGLVSILHMAVSGADECIVEGGHIQGPVIISTMSDDKARWQKTGGFAADTELVQIVCKDEQKKQWTEEASRKGYSSRTEYLLELIREARRYRERGFLAREEDFTDVSHQSDDSSEPAHQQADQGRIDAGVVPPGFIEQILTTQYQSQEDIVQQILESDSLEEHVADAAEDVLFTLAEHDVVEHRRGHGWRWNEEGDL